MLYENILTLREICISMCLIFNSTDPRFRVFSYSEKDLLLKQIEKKKRKKNGSIRII